MMGHVYRSLGIRVTFRVAVAAVSMTVASTAAIAQSHETPEAALAEYIAAYKARDVDRFIASIDFMQEAKEQLSRAKNPSGAPTEVQVQEKADLLVNELRAHFAKFGFRAGSLDNCRMVTKFQDSETQVRIVLSCSDSRGATTFPVRVLQLQPGWRVVRGG